MKSISSTNLIRCLCKNYGFVVQPGRGRGSHKVLRGRVNGKTVMITVPNRETIGTPLLDSIAKQAGLKSKHDLKC